jgi:hypothetical protein
MGPSADEENNSRHTFALHSVKKDLFLTFKEKIRMGFHDLPLTHYLYYRVPTNGFVRNFCLYEKVAVIHP